jgi:hypothetical protein
MLLRSRRGEPLGAREWKRVKARCAWVKKTLDAWHAAQQHMDEVCTEAVKREVKVALSDKELTDVRSSGVTTAGAL